MGYHAINKHEHWDPQCILSAIRGFRNGVVTGVRVRLPYIFQAVVYAGLFREGNVVERIKFIIKQMLFHGRNLGMFVGIYKSLCCLMRNRGIDNGVESLIAGFIGGSFAFGDSNGVSGSVNNQIVLYLFARSVQGLIQTAVTKTVVPSAFSITTPRGFRVFAGITLALALYLTEHQPLSMSSSFMSTMNFLYQKSDIPSPIITQSERNFVPFIVVVFLSLFGYIGLEPFRMENILNRFLDWDK
jgi:peroxisomal membrane protein 4